MTPANIRALIHDALQTEPDFTSVHGLDLTKCLVEPKKDVYRNDSQASPEHRELWTVLVESEAGYRIYFDDAINMFGLGVLSAKNELINIGYFGTFLETLHFM